MENDMSLRELQLLELEILKKFATFCEENDLHYSLLGGTLLGAVRHKGFIPWDDDIDVAMPRPDYNRLLEIVQTKKIAPGLTVVAGDNDDSFSLPFAKVFDENTIVVRDCMTHQDEGEAVWIDIEPYDGVGNDYETAKKIFDKATYYQKTLGRASSIPWKRRPGEKGLTGFLKCLYRLLFRFRGYNYYKRKLIKLGSMNPYADSKYIAIVVSGFYGYGEILEREKFIQYIKMCFEGIEFSVNGAWEEYLRGVYGEYMKLPPEEKRIRPHNLKVLRKENATKQSFTE